MNKTHDGEVSPTVLEKITFAAKLRISAQLVEDFIYESQVKVFYDAWFDDIVVIVRQGILSQKIDEITVRYPADWWQAVKERFAPGWFRRRWPIEWNKTVVDVRAVYPKMAMPEETHSPLTRILESGTAIVDRRGEYTT